MELQEVFKTFRLCRLISVVLSTYLSRSPGYLLRGFVISNTEPPVLRSEWCPIFLFVLVSVTLLYLCHLLLFLSNSWRKVAIGWPVGHLYAALVPDMLCSGDASKAFLRHTSDFGLMGNKVVLRES